MIVVDSSPLIVFARINRFDILKALFGVIYRAIDTAIITVRDPTINFTFNRRLGKGEQGVLNLAREIEARAIIMDDKKARSEARELGFTLFYTTDLLRAAEKRDLIPSYTEVISQLNTLGFYLPG